MKFYSFLILLSFIAVFFVPSTDAQGPTKEDTDALIAEFKAYVEQYKLDHPDDLETIALLEASLTDLVTYSKTHYTTTTTPTTTTPTTTTPTTTTTTPATTTPASLTCPACATHIGIIDTAILILSHNPNPGANGTCPTGIYRFFTRLFGKLGKRCCCRYPKNYQH